MARTVDPEKHEQRRLAIIDAGLTCFAELGYEGATTARISRHAGIGSGTFFHYFPTKAALLLAILEYGTRETNDWFAAQTGRSDPAQVVRDWVRHTADDVGDPRVPGFVRAVGAVMSEPAIAAALAADDEAQRRSLRIWIRRAQQAGQVRTDVSAPTLTSWVLLVLDGFLGRLATEATFTAAGQRRMLLDTVDRLLAP